MTVELDALPLKGETYFFEADGKTIFQTSSRARTRFEFSSRTKTIKFGIRGKSQQIIDNLGNNTLASFGASPPSWTKIYGSWRNSGRFLFWK